MANASIKAAFSQFWLHVVARMGDLVTQANDYTDKALAGKSDSSHNHDSAYDEKGAAADALTAANTYTDTVAKTKANVSHTHTKAEVGLDKVDNTPDSEKDVNSAATANYAETAGQADYASEAGTAGSASKLSTSAGNATTPIYFSNGVPTVCNDLLSVSISGTAATADRASNDENGNSIAGTYATSAWVTEQIGQVETLLSNL